MKKFVSFVVIFLCGLVVNAFGIQAKTLSPEARISVLTASPGPSLYSAFGHNALRLSDPILGIDKVYNYGTFDFDTPNFYLKFLRGKLNYKLSVSSIREFIFEYQSEGRQVIEQTLNLNPQEVQQIYAFLEINSLPENAYYLYDFFYDNCATRIRDVVDNFLSPIWPDDPHPSAERSFRQLLKPYIENTPWARFGIHFILGLPSDQIATPWEYMYLPDEMKIAFAMAYLPDGRPLVSQTSELIPKTFSPSQPSWLSPALLMWALMIIGFLLQLLPKAARVFDKVFFSILGLAGLAISFMWFISEHTSTDINLNILWALPTHLYFVFKSNLGKPTGITKVYFIVAFLLSSSLLVGWIFVPQYLHLPFLPLIIFAAYRTFVYAFGDKVFTRIRKSRAQ